MHYDNTMVAKIAHAAAMELQDAQGDGYVSVPWRALAPEVRANAIAGVEAIRAGMTPKENHERWCTQLTSQGWSKGAARDPYARTHPHLVPWDELTDAQQDRSRLFFHVVMALSMPANLVVSLQFQVPPDAAA